MKNLQNNFTTTEQSNRLIELGVPADSADCCMNGDYVIMLNGKTFQENYNEDLYFARLHLIEYPHYIPCWSVGRLMEICKTCEPKKDYEQLCEELQYSKNYCVLIISHIIANLPIIDFSKLED